MTLQTGSRAAVLRRSEPTRFSVGARRQRRRRPGAIRAERAQRVEQSDTGSRAAVLRRSEWMRFSSVSDDEVGGFRARSAASGASN
jgi:hypothetical protein